MAESERRIGVETNLYNNPHQTVIRNTADFLDNLQLAPRLVDSASAREYLGTRSVPFVRASREHFHVLKADLEHDELADATTLARSIPFRELNPAAGEFLHRVRASEPIGFTIVILSHMASDSQYIPGFTPPETPAEVLDYLGEVEKSLLKIALDRMDPAEIADEPAYIRTKSFFTHGRRIPIKLVESEKERQERINYEMNKLFRLTN